MGDWVRLIKKKNKNEGGLTRIRTDNLSFHAPALKTAIRGFPKGTGQEEPGGTNQLPGLFARCPIIDYKKPK